MTKQRIRAQIFGRVQGVGFRPHVYQIAKQLNLTGWVQNNPSGVLLEAQGQQAALFLARLHDALPALAQITRCESASVPVLPDEQDFAIRSSETGSSATIIAPDTCICADCLHELFDPQSRYYHYPFLNCTQCGPRFTIIRTLPYDRCSTAMAPFPLCEACQCDYQDPLNRRYHAQPTACAECGPCLSLALPQIEQALHDGEIIAVKGLGGFQLICDAANERTLFTLRERKQRVDKPFALMVLNVASAARIVAITPDAESLLTSSARPIVLLKKQAQQLPESIAPGLNELGVMLPSTPLHYLIFHALAGYPAGSDWLKSIQPTVLVVTSANQRGEPLIIDEVIAHRDLTAIADRIITYNRTIETRADDSVVRPRVGARPLIIRRARGYCPSPIQLSVAMPETLALGGHLKNTFCITRGDEAFVSQHIGHLTSKASIDFLHELLTHWLRFLNVTIKQVACDWHPDFYTSQLATSFDLPVVRVQHHHAHLASVMAEHQLCAPAIGLALDGYGLGDRGESWGGELLLLEANHFKRLGHFAPLLQPGGEQAVREPWRMAAGVLHQIGLTKQISVRYAAEAQASLLQNWLQQSSSGGSFTTSCGRLFDAASALLGMTLRSSYEGQAAMQLESTVTMPSLLVDGWRFDVMRQQINWLPLLTHLLNVNQVEGANLFHGTLIAGLTEWLIYWVKKTGIQSVVLGGGCFLNQVLTTGLTERLMQAGITVYLPQQLPANDGGISLGQAWIAGEESCV